MGPVHPVPGVRARAAQGHLHHQQHRVPELPAAQNHQEPRPLPQRPSGPQAASTSTCGTTTSGVSFIKICAYFPYPIKVWVNGHEWAKRQCAHAGIGFTQLSNGFVSCTDPTGLQTPRLFPETPSPIAPHDSHAPTPPTAPAPTHSTAAPHSDALPDAPSPTPATSQHPHHAHEQPATPSSCLPARLTS